MYRMHAIGKFISNFRDFYNEINAATLTGAIDVIVVEQPDGSFTCSPFHVRFGKLGVLRSREKVVDIEVNGEPLDIHMKLGESGEAFFVEEVGPGELGEDEVIPPHLACSPIPQDDGFLARFHEHLAEDKPQDERPTLVELPGTNDDGEQFVLEDLETPQITSVVPDPLQSVPKTFHAETLDDDKSNVKVRKISIAKGEFRPISFEVEEEPSPSVPEVVTIQSQPEEQAPVPVRKDSFKENVLTVDNSLRPNNSGKRKKRRKSMKRKAGLKKNNNNNGGSSSQTEQSELSESGSGVSREFTVKDIVKESESGDAVEAIDSSSTVCEHAPAPVITVTSTESTVTTSELKTTSAENLMELARIQHASTETDFHFFSDTEITPGCTPPDSRPCSPVQSDTEFEMSRHSKAVGTEDDDDPTKSIHGQLQQSWRWGELPSPPPRQLLSAQTPRGSAKKEAVPSEILSSSDEEASKQQQEAAAVAAAEAAAQRSMLSGMFSFMKKTKRIRHNPESEGIYLSDLNADELDPEVAALYFPTSYRQQNQASQRGAELVDRLQDEEDAESGNGTSLPQSPHSVEGAIGGPKSLDSDFEEPKHSVFEKKSYGEISMSLCGGLTGVAGPNEDSFLQSLVTYNDLVQDPKLIENPNLVVRLNGKYYNWRTVCPLVMSLVIFQKPLPQEVIDTLSNEYMPLKKTVVQKKDVKYSGYSSWFSWRRTSEPKKMSVDGQSEEELVSSPESEKPGDMKEPQTPDTPLSDIAETEIGLDEPSKPVLKGLSSIEEEIQKATGYIDSSPEAKEVQGDEMGVATQTNFPLADTRKDSKEEGYSGSNSSDESDSGRGKTKGVKIPKERRSYYEGMEKYRKTLRLSSSQIAGLNLKEGGNEVVFSVTTAYQGTTRCKCHIYKWRFDDKVVISDIDGTITKSDVLGHILPIVGKDWAQSGVAQLFTKIKNNGYRLLYLSARAIGQAHVTREYLRSIKQGDLSLPDGPLLLNPTSLISAFHREVIEKKPEEFKISCLRDIQALFPDDTKPFYAGYGNRINDVWAYRAVGIPIFRIFTINHRGELKHELTQTFQSSYSGQSYIVNELFPPLVGSCS
ncbi:phosphatidate phosphatase LPIN3 isoform X2 [Anabrus simplex]|uniref:phosphatidate phosphatase LPIN3 isoform X2 n=1 Tax=Anabrus simplex TaxID=316456 RepID=UPI0035A3BB4E